MEALIKGKRVLFITSKNLDYIRNTQEISIIKEQALSYDVIGSTSKSYPKRLLYTYFKLLFTSKKNYDVLFFGFSPQLYFFFFPFIKQEIIIDFFISIYDTFVDDRKKVKDGSFLSGIMKKIDHYTLSKANYIIGDTKAHIQYFSETFNIDIKRFKVLYITADTSIYDYNDFPVKKRNPAQLDVLYFGSILPVQGIEVILETMQLLKEYTNIKFIIIGPISKSFEIDPENYPNTRFIQWLSQKELAEEISKSDLCLAGHFSKTIGKANRTIAGKTYIYKAMGKPVILGDSDANRELFGENEMNTYVERGNAKALAQIIISKAGE